MSDLIGNLEDRFSRNIAQIYLYTFNTVFKRQKKCHHTEYLSDYFKRTQSGFAMVALTVMTKGSSLIVNTVV